MKRTEENLQFIRNKYNCEHYIKSLKEKGFIEFRESILLNDLLKIKVLDIRVERELYRTHRNIVKRIKNFYKEFLLK
jgi:hypothetical protein